MMTNRDLSPKDWQALSDYLDGHLSPRRRAALEERLSREPELRQALEDLRALRAALRTLPTLHAPRAFTLPREAAQPVRRAWRLQQWAMVTLAAFALLLAIDLGRTLVFPLGASSPPKQALDLQAQAAPQKASSAPTSETAPMGIQALPEAAAEAAESPALAAPTPQVGTPVESGKALPLATAPIGPPLRATPPPPVMGTPAATGSATPTTPPFWTPVRLFAAALLLIGLSLLLIARYLRTTSPRR